MKINNNKWNALPVGWRSSFLASAKRIVEVEKSAGSLEFTEAEKRVANNLNKKLVSLGVIQPESEYDQCRIYDVGDCFYDFLREITA